MQSSHLSGGLSTFRRHRLSTSSSKGFSLLEVLVVLIISALIFGVTFAVLGQYLRGDRANESKAIEEIVRRILMARQSALNGIDQLESRSVVLSEVKLPDSVEFVTQITPGEFAIEDPVILTTEPIIFAQQSGKLTSPGGLIIVRDRRTQKAQAILVPVQPGPITRFIKSPSDASFYRLTNDIY